MQHPREALAKYTHALSLAPGSLLARFRKARVLMQLSQYEFARAELEQLKDLAPEEANVFFLLGKCYKGLGIRNEAVKAFTIAMNLDAKVRYVVIPAFGVFCVAYITVSQAAGHIKEAMEALSETEDMDQDSDDGGEW